MATMVTTSGVGTRGLESTSAGVGAGTFGERRRVLPPHKLAPEAGCLSTRAWRQHPPAPLLRTTCLVCSSWGLANILEPAAAVLAQPLPQPPPLRSQRWPP